jgi:hypothetical protein
VPPEIEEGAKWKWASGGCRFIEGEVATICEREKEDEWVD